MDLKVNNAKPPTFTAIKYLSGKTESVLEDSLNDEERKEFKRIVKSQEANPVDIFLIHDNTSHFFGNITYSDDHYIVAKTHTQYFFFESPLGFVKRMVKCAEKEKDRIFIKSFLS